jgi:hypothetical protein
MSSSDGFSSNFLPVTTTSRKEGRLMFLNCEQGQHCLSSRLITKSSQRGNRQTTYRTEKPNHTFKAAPGQRSGNDERESDRRMQATRQNTPRNSRKVALVAAGRHNPASRVAR